MTCATLQACASHLMSMRRASVLHTGQEQFCSGHAWLNVYAAIPLVVNHELRELIALAAALGTVEQTDGWQAVAPQVCATPSTAACLIWYLLHLLSHSTCCCES